MRTPLLMLVTATLHSAVSAGTIEARQPSSKWTVDFHESQCVAFRSYGTAAKPLTFALKAPPLGELMELILIRPGRGSKLAEEHDATFRIDSRPPVPIRMIGYAHHEEGRRVSRITLDREALKLLVSAQSLTIDGGARIREGFALSQIGPLLKIMDECVADLRKVWNVAAGDALAPTLKTGAVGTVAGVFRHTDYPQVAIDSEKGGRARVALLIDEKGKVADCTLIETSGVASLDIQSCGIIKMRAKFAPAVGIDGKPAKHAALQAITWRLE